MNAPGTESTQGVYRREKVQLEEWNFGEGLEGEIGDFLKTGLSL
jgi:hypothetical protein